MLKDLEDVVDTTAPGYGKAGARGRDGYFPSPEKLSKQQRIEELEALCIKLNNAVSVGMSRKFKLCKHLEGKQALHLEGKPVLYLRIDCKGMEKEETEEFSQKLKDCGLDAHRDLQPVNSNLGFPGGYTYIAVTGVIKGKTFEKADELSAFAENHPPKRSTCCNIL